MKVFTTGQVAKICKVAPRTVSKWFDSGRLKGYRIPGSPGSQVLNGLRNTLEGVSHRTKTRGSGGNGRPGTGRFQRSNHSTAPIFDPADQAAGSGDPRRTRDPHPGPLPGGEGDAQTRGKLRFRSTYRKPPRGRRGG